MLLFINNSPVEVPDSIKTIGTLLDHLRIKRQGTGVGINSRLVKAADLDNTPLKAEDRLTIISATYGG